jgi:hypothetical protein
MVRPIALSFVLVAVTAVLFQLGLFDWPSLQAVVLEDTFYFLVASSTSKDIGSNIGRLQKGTKEAIRSLLTDDELAAPAALYGAPQGAQSLSAGFYWDNPKETEHPRWGSGWAVPASSMKDAQRLLKKVAAASTLPEPIRLVKIGGSAQEVLRGRIPWRISMTPVIAPMMHWGRYFKIYQDGDYFSYSGREGEEGSVACEIYVTGANDSMQLIDYIIIMGDTHEIFDGMFPQEDKGAVKAEAVEKAKQERILAEAKNAAAKEKAKAAAAAKVEAKAAAAAKAEAKAAAAAKVEAKANLAKAEAKAAATMAEAKAAAAMGETKPAAAKVEAKPAEKQADTHTVTEAAAKVEVKSTAAKAEAKSAAAKVEAKPAEKQADTDTVTEAAPKVEVKSAPAKGEAKPAAAKVDAKPAKEQANTDTVTEAAAKVEAKPAEEQADTDAVTKAAAAKVEAKAAAAKVEAKAADAKAEAKPVEEQTDTDTLTEAAAKVEAKATAAKVKVKPAAAKAEVKPAAAKAEAKPAAAKAEVKPVKEQADTDKVTVASASVMEDMVTEATESVTEAAE